MSVDKAAAGPAADRGLIRQHPLVAYFVIAYAVTWFVEGLFVLSREGRGVLPFTAPMSFAMATGIATSLRPASAAFIVTALTEGREGVDRLLRRIVQWRVGIFWYLFIFIGLPLLRDHRHDRPAGDLGIRHADGRRAGVAVLRGVLHLAGTDRRRPVGRGNRLAWLCAAPICRRSTDR